MTRIGGWPENIQKGPLCANCGVNRLNHDAYPHCDDFVDPTPERPDAAPSKCPLCDIRMVPEYVGITLQCSYCKGTWQEPL